MLWKFLLLFLTEIKEELQHCFNIGNLNCFIDFTVTYNSEKKAQFGQTGNAVVDRYTKCNTKRALAIYFVGSRKRR